MFFGGIESRQSLQFAHGGYPYLHSFIIYAGGGGQLPNPKLQFYANECNKGRDANP